jgi:hypothetical protein
MLLEFNDFLVVIFNTLLSLTTTTTTKCKLLKWNDFNGML